MMKVTKCLSRWRFMILLFGISLTISACYPDDAITTEELDLALTLYDNSANFNSYKTYSMPDSVVFLDELSNQIIVGDNFDEDILAKVRSNLQAYGYEEIDDPENDVPDLVILVSKVLNNNIEAYTYYDWWGYYGWYPYWGTYPYPYGPGWSPYYPWGGTVVYNYETGTVFIEMIDVSTSDESNQEIRAVWAGAINGLLVGSNAEVQNRIQNNIDQLFIQSPYLKIN